MSSDALPCAILFADITGSTKLYETLGDLNAHKLVSACITTMAQVIAEHHGTVIKTIGDEVMCSFAGAAEAVLAAIGMQKAMDAMPAVLSDQRIKPNIRVGLHIGPVIRQGNDIFGDAVNLAARMTSLAKPRQIITTREIVAMAPEHTGVRFRLIDRATVKGKGGEIAVFEVVWEEDGQTLILSPDRDLAILDGRLQVTMGGRVLSVDRDKPALSMGRQVQNDLVVEDSFASRVHARIEYHRGKFILIDQSTNGTYVRMEGEVPVFLHREELVLGPKGMIGLGREVDEASPVVVHFKCIYRGDPS